MNTSKTVTRYILQSRPIDSTDDNAWTRQGYGTYDQIGQAVYYRDKMRDDAWLGKTHEIRAVFEISTVVTLVLE